MMKSSGKQPDPRIAEGKKLLSGRRFADAYDVLDQALAADRRNPHILVLLGIACLYQDFLEDAEHFFRKAIELDLDNADARSGLAFVLMRTDRVADATEELCDILRVRPYHPFARKRFKELKKAPSLEAYIAGIHPSMFVALPQRDRFGFLKKISPPPWLRRTAIIVIVVCVALLVYFSARDYEGSSLWKFFSEEQNAPDPYFPSGTLLDTDIGKSLSRAIRAAETPPELFLSDHEVSSLLTLARRLLNDGEHNEARHVLNRLLASNADRISLAAAQSLDAFVREPSPDKMHFNPLLGDIAEGGAFYRGVYVKWLTRVVRATDGAFLQVAPARYHGNEDDSVQVVVLEENAQAFTGGARVEVFGEVLGVDALSDTQKVVYINGKQLTRFERSR